MSAVCRRYGAWRPRRVPGRAALHLAAEDASTPLKCRDPKDERGLTNEYRLLYVVHVVREGNVLRLISARLAEPAERRRYEND